MQLAASHVYPRTQLRLHWFTQLLDLLQTSRLRQSSLAALKFILDTLQHSHSAASGKWRDEVTICSLTFFFFFLVWPTFTLFQNSHHTLSPQTRYFKFPKKKTRRDSERRCFIVLSSHLLTGGRESKSERTETCHSTSGGWSHNAAGIWLSGAGSQS